jgi:hypothetical protein
MYTPCTPDGRSIAHELITAGLTRTDFRGEVRDELRVLEVGVKFQVDTAGYINGIRFYKGSGNTGTHVGNLWTTTGKRLATVAFAGETAGGWQQMNFASAVAIAANTTYIASYHMDAGHYTGDLNGLSSAVDRAAPRPIRREQRR